MPTAKYCKVVADRLARFAGCNSYDRIALFDDRSYVARATQELCDRGELQALARVALADASDIWIYGCGCVMYAEDLRSVGGTIFRRHHNCPSCQGGDH